MSGTNGVGKSRVRALHRLQLTEADAYHSLIEHVPGILYISEPGIDARWLYVSPQVESILGWTAAEWLADPTLFSRLIHPDDRHLEEGAELLENTVLDGRHTSEYRLTTRDGRVRWFRDDATLVAADDTHPSAWTGVLTDITDQRQSEHLLRRSHERARAILDTATDAYVAFDGAGVICDWNRAGEWMLGWTREQIIGQSVAETLIPKRHTASSLAELTKAREADDSVGGRTFVRTVVRRDGTELPVEVTLWRTHEEDGVSVSAFLRDITERDALQAQLIRQAFRDDLTGFANRALFHQRVAERLADPAREAFAVLMIGLDDFRSVNDSLGHAAAGELLKAVADRLAVDVSTASTFARLSEDELAMIVDAEAPSDALLLAEGLQKLLKTPTWCGGRQIAVRVSIGVRHCAVGAEVDVEEVLSDAGAAMSTATRSGRGLAAFENRMRADQLRRLQLAEELEHAVSRGEISVHYQPYFSFADGSASGVEALARWRHPVLGDVQPSEFIPLAESTGQIKVLGLFVLTRACRDIATLRRQHHEHRDLMLSVNVSPRQLVDDEFQQELHKVLDDTAMPGEALMLELTETALVEDAHGVAERLSELRRSGVHVAVDDFGTRYASLAYLQRFPIDTLKVDRTFISQMHESSHEQRLAGAIITLAKTLGLRTIAEGIEETDHATRLVGLGCDAGQGFLFTRPVAIEGLLATLRSGAERAHEGLAVPDPLAGVEDG
ncbi:MAG TPA: EAL domain-containing protein [Nocardioidaceae bacterium]|nr:EAL domain-containing protein [Nocardioidaceae bacterium]